MQLQYGMRLYTGKFTMQQWFVSIFFLNVEFKRSKTQVVKAK